MVTINRPAQGNTNWFSPIDTNWANLQNALNQGQGVTIANSTPTQLSANQNDYAFAGGNSAYVFQRLSASVAVNITGFSAGSDGQRYVLANVGSFNITITNQDTSSQAANRVITGTGGSVTLAPDQLMDLVYDGTTARWRVEGIRASSRLNVQATTQSVVNTTTETTVYSFTVPANSMGADGMLRLWISHRLGCTGINQTATIRVKFGATTVAVHAPTVSGPSGLYRGLLEVRIANKATNSQRISTRHSIESSPNADSSTEVQLGRLDVINSSSLDTTSNQTLAITVQWGTSPGSNPSYEMLYATLELVK